MGLEAEKKIEKIKELMISYLTPQTCYEYAGEVAELVIAIIDDLPECKTLDELCDQGREIAYKYGKFNNK